MMAMRIEERQREGRSDPTKGGLGGILLSLLGSFSDHPKERLLICQIITIVVLVELWSVIAVSCEAYQL